MIFMETWRQVLDGSKTQTRKLVKEGDLLIMNAPSESYVVTGNDIRLKWQVGRTYAVQPGRGKRAVGRIRLTAIRREALQDISTADCLAEGAAPPTSPVNTDARVLALCNRFARLWDSVNRQPGAQFFDNPDVWVLTFELVELLSPELP